MGDGRNRPPIWWLPWLVDDLKAQVDARAVGADAERLRRELTVEAIYHTNRIEGNPLTLPEVRAVVEAFWAEGQEAPGAAGCVMHRKPAMRPR